MLGESSLICKASDTCPADMRCHQGLCVFNTAPLITGPGSTFATPINAQFSLSGEATDPEGDAITFRWQQVSGPGAPLLTEPLVSQTLTLSPLQLGLHVFELSVDDGGTPDPARGIRRINVMVQPQQSAIYVADRGIVGETCGTYDTPCQNLVQGIANMRAQGQSTIILATGATYTACLDLGANETLRAGFDPTHWTEDSAARTSCRIECNNESGHNLSGTAQVSNAVLSMAPAVRPSNPFKALVAVHLQGAPLLTNVDIEAPACGNGCIAMGLSSIDASPTLTDVDVVADVVGFNPLYAFVGMSFVGGNPTLIGSPQERSVDDNGRGGVLLNAPVEQIAIGVIARNTTATFANQSILGGMGLSLVGLSILGGDVTVEGSLVQLVGFGARTIAGVHSEACGTNASASCLCDGLVQDCNGSVVEVASPPKTTLVGNSIVLTAASDSGGLVPCLANGIGHYVAASEALIENNHIVIGDHFTSAMGVAVVGTLASDAGANVLRNNNVTLGSAEVDSLCQFLNQQSPNSGVDAAAIGVAVLADEQTVVQGNQVTVGNNAASSMGLYVVGGGDHTVRGNDLLVGTDTSPVVIREAYGAVLQLNATATQSTFAQNRAMIAGGAASGAGLGIAGTPTWSVTNNMIFGGTIKNAVGLSLLVDTTSATHPYVAHNTILGGGDATSGLSSRAILVAAFDSADSDSTLFGRFENNLLDAGNAQGRRYIFDNVTLNMPAERTGNVAQFFGTITGPQPVMILPYRQTALRTMAWPVLVQGSGEFTSLMAYTDGVGNSTMTEGKAIPTLGRPSAYWFGELLDQPAVALVVPDGIAFARVVGNNVTDFVVVPTTSYVGGVPQARNPVYAAYADINEEFPPDLVFLERATQTQPGSVWYMPGLREGGFSAPIKADGFPVQDPTLIAANSPLKTLRTAQFLFVDGTTLYAYPQKLSMDMSQLLYEGDLVPNTIDHIDSVDFVSALKGNILNNEGSRDIVLVGHATGGPRRLFFFENPNLADGTPTAKKFGTEPCISHSGVVSYTVGELLAYADLEFAVACEDGFVEVYRSNGSQYVLAVSFNGGKRMLAMRPGILDGNVTTRAPLIMLAEGTPASGIATHAELRMVTQTISPMGAATAGNATVYEFVKDIAYRNTGTGGFETTFASLPSAGVALATTPCALALREPDAQAFDLHLLSTDASCKDQGAILVEPIVADIDGDNTRTDSLPDVGCDEVP